MVGEYGPLFLEIRHLRGKPLREQTCLAEAAIMTEMRGFQVILILGGFALLLSAAEAQTAPQDLPSAPSATPEKKSPPEQAPAPEPTTPAATSSPSQPAATDPVATDPVPAPPAAAAPVAKPAGDQPKTSAPANQDSQVPVDE